MEPVPDLPLEMLMLMPAAALAGSFATPPKAKCGGPRVEAHLPRDGFLLTARGWFDAKAVFDKVRPILASCPAGGHLTVDLRQTHGFDQLALSALVVVLRAHCLDMDRIAIWGLEPTCLDRLCQTGAENLFGCQWRDTRRADEIIFLKTRA